MSVERNLLELSGSVREAVGAGRPVVALESTLITHGLPRPTNLEVAVAAEAAVRDTGAVPATVCVLDGRLRVGLSTAELVTLAEAPDVAKVSRHNLAAVVAGGGWGATTVSATMIAARLAGIGVFATGGIGGVHRGALGASDRPEARRPTLDISGDLDELARTAVTVVCAGPKQILDVPLTLEYLETRGVPVLALGTDRLPGFYSRDSGLSAPSWVSTLEGAAAVVLAHRELGLAGGVLLCVPVPASDELPLPDARAAIERAEAEAAQAGIRGAALTPWLLERVGTLTHGRALQANRALIVNNARVAAELAKQLAG